MKFKNLIGKLKGYSGCLRCGDTWDYKKGHHTEYELGRGCFPLCEECWLLMSRKERLRYYKELYDSWDDPNHANWHEIENAVMNGK